MVPTDQMLADESEDRLHREAQALLDACVVAVYTFSQPRGSNVALEMATLNLLRMTIHAATGGAQ